MSKYLVSSSASKVLLALLLVREREAVLGLPEFAKLAGLSEQLTQIGLHEVGQVQLIVTITQKYIHMQEQGEPDVQVVNAKTAGLPDRLVLEEGTREGAAPVAHEKDGGLRFISTRTATLVPDLQELWDEVFPVAEYPVQRLTKETAKQWIRKYGDDFVREVLIDVRHTTTKKIESPRGYVDWQLKDQWEKKQAPGESEITDELRELTRMGRRQHDRHKDADLR